MFKKSIPILMFATICCAGAASAAGAMKPGLWEMTMKSDQMKAMPKMSPQQMEQMRKMGVNLPQMQEGGMVMKLCITKEMAEREKTPFQDQARQHQSECKPQNMKQSGNSYSAELICDGPNMQGEGKMQGTFSGNESYSSTYDFKGVARGKPITQHHETNAKWLGADCGDVKPVGEYMPKNRK